MAAVNAFRFVLMRPRSSQNLGAAARALKNFGLRDWVWVEAHAQADEDARRMAVHAEDVLTGARTAGSLLEAVQECAWVVGTSSPRKRRRTLTPREFAALAHERAATGRVALVFGDERSGLMAEELRLCHDLSTIPTHEDQPSLNLAQAILLYGYELFTARAPAPRAETSEPGPQDQELRRLEETWRRVLRGVGFLQGDPRHALEDLMTTLRRARLTSRELRLWESALGSTAKWVEGRS